jgi:mRNA interferase MazF
MMIARVQKWGNSQGLRLSKETLDNADISVGDEVDVAVRDGLILIAPAKRLRGKYKLSDLVKRISSDYETQELQWGEVVGKEVW